MSLFRIFKHIDATPKQIFRKISFSGAEIPKKRLTSSKKYLNKIYSKFTEEESSTSAKVPIYTHTHTE